MPADFRWQTEDDNWDNSPTTDDKPVLTKNLPWFKILAVLLFVSAFAFILYTQIQRQLEAAVSRTEDEISGVHNLVLQAADEGDRDLLNNLISSRNTGWLHQTLEIAGEGILYNPVPFGFRLQPDREPELSFNLNPDLSAAEVSSTRYFSVLSANGNSESVALEQTAIYRRGESRWLLSPPEDTNEFWGGTLTYHGRYLDITYPERDAEQVESLANFLEGKVAEMCNSLFGLSCPENFHLVLTLDTEPVSQLEMLTAQSELLIGEVICPDLPDGLCSPGSQFSISSGSSDGNQFEVESTQEEIQKEIQLSLPTISLVGTPVDQTSSRALQRGYAAYALQAGLIHLLEINCCEHAMLVHAWLDYQLQELDLQPYPIHPNNYEDLFGRFQQIDLLSNIWHSREFDLTESENWPWGYALTEFILSTSLSDAAPIDMLNTLHNSSDYQDWLDGMLIESAESPKVRQAWLNFIYGNSLSGRVVQGGDVPNQNIVIRCENISSPRTVLYRFDWESSDWLMLDQFEQPTLFMDALPDDSALIVQQRNLDGPSSTFRWEDGDSDLINPGSADTLNAYYYIGRLAPDGQKLVMRSFDRAVGYRVLDLSECSEGGCKLALVPGLPKWSPDSSQMILELLIEENGFSRIAGLNRVDSTGTNFRLTELGYSPFWLDNQEYGYIEIGQNPGIYTASIDDDQPKLRLIQEDLLEILPQDQRPDSLTIRQVDPNPVYRNLSAITTYNIDSLTNQVFIFLWNRQSGQITHLALIDHVVIGIPEWLPSGDWLLVPTFQERGLGLDRNFPWSYYLFNQNEIVQDVLVSSQEFRGFNGLDYSIDGKWLVAMNADYLELVNLEENVAENRPLRQILPYPFQNCQEAVFIW